MIHRDRKHILAQRQHMFLFQHGIKMRPVDLRAEPLCIHDDVKHLTDAYAPMQEMLDEMHDQKQHVLRMRKRIDIASHDLMHSRMRKRIRKETLIRPIRL